MTDQYYKLQTLSNKFSSNIKENILIYILKNLFRKFGDLQILQLRRYTENIHQIFWILCRKKRL